MAKWQPQDTYSVSIGKTGESVAVATGNFSDAVLAHVFEYGLRQILNDAGASEKDAAGKVAAAQKRYANLVDGNLRAARESDPVRAEARKIATAKVDAAIRKAGKKPDAVENRADLINQLMARDDVQAAARAAVEATKGLDIEIDV